MLPSKWADLIARDSYVLPGYGIPRIIAYGLTDAPVAFHMSLRNYLVNSAGSPSKAGLKFEVSTIDPR